MRPDTQPGGQNAGSSGSHSFIEDARRTQIMTCAIDVLAEFGYAHTTLARVARAAGVSKGVISYHFSGKDELLEQVVTSVYTAGAEYVAPMVAAATTASEKLRTYLRSNIEFLRDHHTHIVALTEVVLNLRRADGRLRFSGEAEGVEPMLAPLQEVFRQGQVDGEFRDFDRRTMAWNVRTLIDGINQRRTVEPELDFDACADELVTMFDLATRS